ncbi:MAG: glycosyltransferase family 39 protein [Chloroflexota bacterium]|nr:MAG: hypothetical protein DIU68_11855 [Chloroflexota bacterium]
MRYALIVVLALLYWATRLPALDALPLHNDEGLHLTRAVEVWNLHPFWQISDGKIINHWLIAAFDPRNAPVFVGRIATLFAGMAGVCAGYALARRASRRGSWLAAVLWIACPYLFFYERMALSDAEAGALVVIAVLAALRLARRPTPANAIITGAALAGAILFKFTAAPFAFTVALIVIALGNAPLRQRMASLALVAGVVVLAFSVPLAYLALRGSDFFSIALGWISSGGGDIAVSENLQRLAAQLTDFGPPVWSLALIAGLIALPLTAGRRGVVLLLGLLVPLGAMVVLGTEVLPRHYVAALPLAVSLAGAGLEAILRRLSSPAQQLVPAGAAVALLLAFAPFMLQARRDPAQLPLPTAVRTQYITDHSSGYGLREAVQDFPNALPSNAVPVIGSMFPDSCRRANFYATETSMLCADAPGIDAIETALETHGSVYVLVDHAGLIGVDVTTLNVRASQIAAYPRPGETGETASVVLWRLER